VAEAVGLGFKIENVEVQARHSGTFIISATWEAEVGGFHSETGGQNHKTVSEK
jgi:hypothetical protein